MHIDTTALSGSTTARQKYAPNLGSPLPRGGGGGWADTYIESPKDHTRILLTPVFITASNGNDPMPICSGTDK